MITKWIEDDYREAVQLLPEIPEELRKALKTHERVPKFFEGLQKEFATIEQRKIKMTREDVKKVVYDLTMVFVACLKRRVDEQSMSDLGRLISKNKAQKIKDLDETADGKPSGEYIELLGENGKCR